MCHRGRQLDWCLTLQIKSCFSTFCCLNFPQLMACSGKRGQTSAPRWAGCCQRNHTWAGPESAGFASPSRTDKNQQLDTPGLITEIPDQVFEMAERNSQNLCQWAANGCRQVMAAQTGDGSSAPSADNLLSHIKAQSCSKSRANSLPFFFYPFPSQECQPLFATDQCS